MSLELFLRVDDLSVEESAAVVGAYECALADGEHEEAFERALGALRAFRPVLPLNVAAAELELLLDGMGAPGDAASAAVPQTASCLLCE